MRKRQGILFHAHVEELERIAQFRLLGQERLDFPRRRIAPSRFLGAFLLHWLLPRFRCYLHILSRKPADFLKRSGRPWAFAKPETTAALLPSTSQGSQSAVSRCRTESQCGDRSRARRRGFWRIIGAPRPISCPRPRLPSFRRNHGRQMARLGQSRARTRISSPDFRGRGAYLRPAKQSDRDARRSRSRPLAHWCRRRRWNLGERSHQRRDKAHRRFVADRGLCQLLAPFVIPESRTLRGRSIGEPRPKRTRAV